jgi:hypothetical protein
MHKLGYSQTCEVKLPLGRLIHMSYVTIICQQRRPKLHRVKWRDNELGITWLYLI